MSVKDRKLAERYGSLCNNGSIFLVSSFSGNLVHWEREKKPGAETYPSFYSRAPSAEIELTAYIALAFLEQSSLSKKDLTFIYQIISWLVKQQNPYGGFSSTQVTSAAKKSQ